MAKFVSEKQVSDLAIAIGHDIGALRDKTRGIYADRQEMVLARDDFDVGAIVSITAEAASFVVVSGTGDLSNAAGVAFNLVPRGDARDLIALGFDTSGFSDMSALLRSYLARRPSLYVKLPGGTVRLDSTVDIPSETSLDLGNTKFALGNLAVNAPAFRAEGSAADIGTISANVARGAVTLPVSLTSFVTAGDILKIKSSKAFDPARTNMKCGELVRVASASPGVITLIGGLMDSYAVADTVVIQKITPVRRINVHGGASLDGGNTNGRKAFLMRYGIDSSFSNIDCLRFSDRAFWLQDCDNVNGFSLNFEDFDSASTGYGISCVDATQNCRFQGITGRRVRHLFATNNTSAGGGIPRRIVVDGFIADASAMASGGTGGDAMDTHAASEDIHFWNGFITGSTGCGVNMEGAGGSVKNVHVRGAATHGIYASNFSGRKGRIEIAGCTTQDTGQSGIRVNSGTSQEWEFVKIDAVIERALTFPLYVGINSAVLSTDIRVSIIDSVGDTQAQVQKCRNGTVDLSVRQSADTTGSLRMLRLRDAVNIKAFVTGEIGNADTLARAVFVDSSEAGASRNLIVSANVRNRLSGGIGVQFVAGLVNAKFDAANSNIDGFATATNGI